MGTILNPHFLDVFYNISSSDFHFFIDSGNSRHQYKAKFHINWHEFSKLLLFINLYNIVNTSQWPGFLLFTLERAPGIVYHNVTYLEQIQRSSPQGLSLTVLYGYIITGVNWMRSAKTQSW